MTINIPSPANWKTTAVGMIGAALGFWNAYQIHDWHSIIRDPVTLAMFVLALLGVVGKDSNVTGGTVGQPSTPAALVASNVAPSPANPPAPPK